MTDALEIYFKQEHDEAPIIVQSEAELDAALDQFAADEPGVRALAQLAWRDDPWRAVFEIGVYNGETGVLYYSGDSAPEGVTSLGDNADTELEVWYFVRADTEYQRSAEVPFTAVHAAAHEYFRTGGEQPTAVNWRPGMPGGRIFTPDSVDGGV
ncbi:Imm1 family immunity protein [Saccharopolyspora taberi]|uniref:Immunity protein Imm1 n=1 Tax=Saccharopolyspora taberi TaxID=60895 RepID=A0ABN3V233_9PSEU